MELNRNADGDGIEEATGESDLERLGVGPDGTPIRRNLDTVLLASVGMPHGTTIEFIGTEGGGTGVVEIGGSSDTNPVFRLEPHLSLLEMYLRLAPADAPVPRMLLQTEDFKGHLAGIRTGRSTTDIVEERIEVDENLFDIIAGIPISARSCGAHSPVNG